MEEFHLDIESLFNTATNSIQNFLPKSLFEMLIPIIISSLIASFLHKMLDMSYIKCFTVLLLAQYLFLSFGSYALKLNI